MKKTTVDSVHYLVAREERDEWVTAIEALEPEGDHYSTTSDGIGNFYGYVRARMKKGRLTSQELRSFQWENASLALKIIHAAYPNDFERGEKPVDGMGAPLGYVELVAVPDVIAQALGDCGIVATNMEDASEKLAAFLAKVPAGVVLRYMKLLSHALKYGDVKSQIRWATWCIDPEKAVTNEIEAMNR